MPEAVIVVSAGNWEPLTSLSSSMQTGPYTAWAIQAPIFRMVFYISTKLSLCLTNSALCHEDVWGAVCIDPRILDIDISWSWVSSFTPRPLYPREKGIHWIGGWVNLRTGMDKVERRKILPLPGLELRPLGRPAPSQPLYWLRYSLMSYLYMYISTCLWMSSLKTTVKEAS
jgi:hypothetical protein